MKNLLLLMVLMSNLCVFAFQFPDPKLVQANKDKNLIIILQDTSEIKFVNIGPEEKQDYIRTIEIYNAAVQSVFPELWKASTGTISFVKSSEIATITKEVFAKSLVVVSGFRDIADPTERKFEMYEWLLLSYDEKVGRQKYFRILYEADHSIEDADVTFFVQQANTHILAAINGAELYADFINLDSTMLTITEKKLLIDEGLTGAPIEDLIKKYPGQAEIVSTADVDIAIRSKSASTLYIKLIYGLGFGGGAFYGLFDAVDGHIIGVSSIGGVSVYTDLSGGDRRLTRVNTNGVVTYDYKINPLYTSGDKVSIFRSKVGLAPIHMNVLYGKAQKVNFKYFDK